LSFFWRQSGGGRQVPLGAVATISHGHVRLIAALATQLGLKRITAEGPQASRLKLARKVATRLGSG
jgi:porphobilinogen deaminase